MHQVFAGRIVDIQKREHRGAYLKQGVKQEQQSYYDNREGYYGSNGTYVTGFEYFGVLRWKSKFTFLTLKNR